MARWRALARGKLRGLRRRLPLLYLSLPFVRRRLSHRARVAWSESRTIAFVCYGNICRSPFAEALARQRVANGRVAVSAGYFPRPGRTAPAHALETARAWGVDLTSHRSRVLTGEMVDEADAIFVFDHDNVRNVVSMFPTARGKVHYLGALAERGPVFIADPFGRSAAQFERTYRLIADSLESAGR